MRNIDKPSYKADIVFSMCVDSVGSEDLKNRLNAISLDIYTAAEEYDAKAKKSELFKISPYEVENDTIVVGKVSNGELKGLYSDQMVGKTKPARMIYENLRSLSAGKLCPLCGFGHVKTLDHYLPKSKFPLYSVLPYNLVPACRDCNTEKLASTATTAGAQSIHPYYDPKHFFSEQWLFAEVLHTSPATVNFYVDPPDAWDNVSKERVASHFNDFKLSDRFSVQVVTELAAIRNDLSNISDEVSRQQHLTDRAKSYCKNHKNSWQTALVQALANSEWYCRVGFQAEKATSRDCNPQLAVTANIQYCIKCERPATHKHIGLPVCEYHLNPDVEERDIPQHKGVIPDGSVCVSEECDQTPTKIYGGACFCHYHYKEAKQGKRLTKALESWLSY